jgi:hypothetical protein
MSRALKVARRAPSARDVWDEALERAAARMEQLTAEFAAGRASEAEYVLEMRRLVKSLHMGGLAVGSGGVARVTATDLRRLGPLLRDEYRHLARKVGRIQAGERPAEQEARMAAGFARQARSTFENARREKAPARYTHERWVRHNDDSCPGCIRQGGRVLPRGMHPPHGSLDCGGNCLCTIELVESP